MVLHQAITAVDLVGLTVATAVVTATIVKEGE